MLNVGRDPSGTRSNTVFEQYRLAGLFTEEFATWARHLQEQKTLIIPDVEAIRDIDPKEYQRLDARSIMGVPFGQHPLGFMVIRNGKRYVNHSEPLQLACFVAMMMLDFSDQIRVTTDAEEMEELYHRAMKMHDGEDKIVLLKKVFSLYRSRLFVQGEDSIGGWLLPYTAHYNQVFVDITTELLKMLGRRRDFRCIMDYAPVALEKEPGMQTAYFWTIVAADGIGNSIARDKALDNAKIELTDEEYVSAYALRKITPYIRCKAGLPSPTLPLR